MTPSSVEWDKQLWQASKSLGSLSGKPRVKTPLPAPHHPLDGTSTMSSFLTPSPEFPSSSSQGSLVSSEDDITGSSLHNSFTSMSCMNRMKVIVHKVQPTDTLPGISILYGITVIISFNISFGRHLTLAW
jgi:hypothetical protein